MMIYHGSMVRNLTLDRLRGYRHSEGFGHGVSFSKKINIAKYHTGMYGSFIETSADHLKLYPLTALEQVFRRRSDGRSLATLFKENYDGIDFLKSVEALKLYGEIRLLRPGTKVGPFKIKQTPLLPFIEHEVFVFTPSLIKIKNVKNAIAA